MTQAIDQDLICAVATPPGQGGIGVVRLSGQGARHIAEIVCARKLVARRAVYCDFVDGSEPLDNGIALWFPEPNSFTGCLLYTSPSPRDLSTSRMPSSA